MVFMDEGGLSTQGGLVQHYHDVSDGERYNFVFDYASRLDLIGDVLPPDATVTVSLYYCDREKRMYGNCSKEDVRTECPICLCNESYTDVELHCGHRFHDLCLANMRKMVCPLCRAPISDEDKTKIYADLIVTDEDGVVVHLDGTFAIV